ncbi:MAG: LON peptidase substrate-binding domain-containing protein, partial [Erysipelotrichaceae bacterium]|nr:LON peptidase substrate-binding domain-containing protein [Erysipelotrichaceae bacterium]
MSKINDYPLLCTRGAVIFPLQELSIEVGREDSIQAVNYALNNSLNIVLVSQIDLTVDLPREEDLYTYGTLCRIKSSRNRGDHLKVIFAGIARVKIFKHFINDGIRYVTANILDEDHGDELEIEVYCKKALTEFNLIAQKYSRPGFPIGNVVRFDSTLAASLVDTFAQIFIQEVAEKERYLEETSIKRRLEMMMEYISREKQMDVIEREINEKVKERIEEGQKDYYLREKLKAIKDELGDTTGVSDIDDLKEKLENNPYPENVKAKAREEFRHYEMIPQASGESGVIRSY